MGNALAPVENNGAVAHVGYDAAAIMEQVIATGDLSRLSPSDRTRYYMARCESMGLNPLSEPLLYVSLNGKLQLYAGKNCAEQIRGLRKISLRIISREVIDGCYVVTAAAKTPEGQCDESTGVVDLGTLKGEARANAMMKAETKAKRRVTLSICGMGLLDETEVASIPAARLVDVDKTTGEILDAEFEPDPQPAPAKQPSKADVDRARKGLRARIARLKSATHPDDVALARADLDDAYRYADGKGWVRAGGETETDVLAALSESSEMLDAIRAAANEDADSPFGAEPDAAPSDVAGDD